MSIRVALCNNRLAKWTAIETPLSLLPRMTDDWRRRNDDHPCRHTLTCWTVRRHKTFQQPVDLYARVSCNRLYTEGWSETIVLMHLPGKHYPRKHALNFSTCSADLPYTITGCMFHRLASNQLVVSRGASINISYLRIRNFSGAVIVRCRQSAAVNYPSAHNQLSYHYARKQV